MFPGCVLEIDRSEPNLGTSSAECYPNDTCNTGLACVDDRCVLLNGIDSGPIDASEFSDLDAALRVDAGIADSRPSDSLLSDASPSPNIDAGTFIAFDAWTDAAVADASCCDSSVDAGQQYDDDVWIRQSPTTVPSDRFDQVMAYDTARDRTVMFGGQSNSGGGALNETWEWDGANWNLMSPPDSPPATVGAAMTYDSTGQQMVMFGGYVYGTGAIAQTWTWDGMTWTQQHPSTSPPAREGFALAYDSHRGRVVLFGSEFLNDTWEWDGANWWQLSPAHSPSALYGPSLAFDAARSQIVLFGGSSDELGDVGLNDTWTWDGIDWTHVTPTRSPDPRYFASMAYDSRNSHLVLYGGIQETELNNGEGGISFQSSSFPGETWSWDGTIWTQLSPSSSAPVPWTSMAYDSVRDEMVIYGGDDGIATSFDQTWTFHASN